MVPTTGQYMCASRPSAFRSPCQIMTRRFATPFSGRRCAMPFSGSQLNRPACGSCVLHAVRAIQEADRQHTGPQCVPHHSAHIPMPGVGQCSRTIAGPRCGEALTHSALHTRAARARRRVSLGLAPAGNPPGLYLSICLSGNYRSVITSHVGRSLLVYFLWAASLIMQARTERRAGSTCALAAAKHNVQALLQERRQTFWAAHATQRAVIAFLVRTNITIRSVVDIGAAEYLYGRGTTADESSLHNTFRQLGSNAHYYGFDPGLSDIRGLQRAARRDARVPRRHAHFYPLALAGTPGRTRLLGEPTWRRVKNGTISSWQPRWSMRSSPKTRTTNQRLEGLHQYRHIGWVNATTLDLFASRESLPGGIDFVKVDTEGTEREVLLEGAAELLRSRRVRTILWEYGDTISADTFLAAKSPTFVPPPSPDAMHGPNLKRVTAELFALGYRCLFSAPQPG